MTDYGTGNFCNFLRTFVHSYNNAEVNCKNAGNEHCYNVDNVNWSGDNLE